MLRIRLPLTSLLACFALQGATCATTGDDATCVACGNAVDLTVVDVDGAELTVPFNVEATLDDALVDTSACAPEQRTSASQCSFGVEAGVYHVVVRAPGFVDEEAVVRFAARSGELCAGTCLPRAAQLRVRMNPS